MHWIAPMEAVDVVLPLAAARGILLAVLLSSVFWMGLVLTVWILW